MVNISQKTADRPINSAESKPKSKKDTVAAVAAKGVSFYDTDDDFNLVLLHQPRQSDQLPVESVSVGPAVLPVQSTPVVAIVSVPTATRDLLNLLEPSLLVPDSDDEN